MPRDDGRHLPHRHLHPRPSRPVRRRQAQPHRDRGPILALRRSGVDHRLHVRVSRPLDSRELAMAAHVNRKEYWMIFGALFALTILEVGVVYMGIAKTPLFIALSGLALVKASLVGLFFMHLKHETQILRRSVAIPMSIPAFYALILIAEGAWRRLPWW